MRPDVAGDEAGDYDPSTAATLDPAGADMQPEALAKLVDDARCRVLGHQYAGNGPHRAVLAALVRGFDRPGATILCETGLARGSSRPPDCVVVDALAGVHVVEVKGVALDQVEAVRPGGLLSIRYRGVVATPKGPVAQARLAMFDIKHAAERAVDGPLDLPLLYWAVLASITRDAWHARWGPDAYAPPELLFADDIPGLAARLAAIGAHALANRGLARWPADQLDGLWRAFGDSSVLAREEPGERDDRHAPELTLGAAFDDASEAYKTLSDDQQRLSTQDWAGGPRLVRGVAGSGKTIVLANNLARRARRAEAAGPPLPGVGGPPRLLAVCYNRTLVPLLRAKVDLAYRQGTGRPLPAGAVEVRHYNSLLWELAQRGLWRYQRVDDAGDEARARRYLDELAHVAARQPDLLDALAFDALYVDEGQDFLEDDFRLLKGLCRAGPDAGPDLHIFYDDAQNLLGRRRPNWRSLGLNMAGRSHVMTECFRNARPVVEAAFNVLYGRFAEPGAEVPRRDYSDLGPLEAKGLVRDRGDHLEVLFAPRAGMRARLTVAVGPAEERGALVERLRWLIGAQQVRPEDVLVLARTWDRLDALAHAIRAAAIPGVEAVHVAKDDQDRTLRRRGVLPLATVASAKGYDAYCVLLAAAADFTPDLAGRAGFYVGCTRAIEYLEVFAHRRSGLVGELERALARLADRAPDAEVSPAPRP